jgi:GT2 family glycosyltransferase
MKVGVVVPVYNVLRYIEMCLTSLNAQTYPVSVYVVDDASTDGTREFLRARPHLYTDMASHTERVGWPCSLNNAATLAIDGGCDAVFTMNADDFLRLDCIEKCVEFIKDYDWVVVYAQQVGAENVVQISKENATLEDFKRYPPLVNYALIPSHIWQQVGGYSTDITLPNSYGYKEDWEFWIKIFKANYTNYAVVKEPVYYYVMHDGQLHESGLNRTEEARQVILKKHNLL